MFRTLKRAPLAVGFLPFRFVPREDSLVLIVKGTYRMEHGGRAAPIDTPDPISGDVMNGDDPLVSACTYASDVVPRKARADVVLTGKVHTPEGRPLPQCSASLSVGRASLSLLVTGDRFWLDPSTGAVSEPRPFTEMPLGYERAFGGPGYAANPAGKGVFEGAREAIERPLPNLEDPRELVKRPQDRPAPAGFGPLSVHAAHRASKWPRLGAGWVEERWPHPPDEIDYGYFNAAQPALQIEGYLRGDERIVCENLSPRRRRYECELPRVRARAFVLDVDPVSRDRERFREVGLRLDTLAIDMEAEKLVLVWRGSVPVASEGFDEIEYAYIALEALDEPRASAEEHRRAFEIARIEAEATKEPEAPPVNDNDAPRAVLPPQRPDVPKPPSTPLLRDDEKARLAAMGHSPEVIAALDRGDFGAAMSLARTAWGGGEGAFDELLARSTASIKAALAKAGHDPSIVDPVVKPKPPPKPAPPEPPSKQPWTRARVEAALIGDIPLRGEDLSFVDLSEMDLRKRDLRGTILRGASLAGARLDEANLEGASLAEALAERCSLRSAKLAGADLTGARLPEAALRGADLSGAVLDDAVLTRASLEGARAERAYLRRADLSGADLSKGTFKEARLDGARLDGAGARGADFTGASAEGVSGDSVDLRGSILVRFNASEGSKLPRAKLSGAKGDGSRWSNASLEGADLSRSSLRGADLSAADLSDASLRGSDLHEANLTQSKLRRATLDGARLWAARMEDADLRRASLKGAILHQAGLRGARIEGADLEGASTTGTLFDSPVRGWAR